MTREAFGIDIGGTGVKGALVDLDTGKLIGDRFKVATPRPATPAAVSKVVGQVVSHFDWKGPVGATFPGVVKDGVVKTAANVDKSWIGMNAATLFGNTIGASVTVVNDADAAGLAEAKWGAAAAVRGVTLLLTLGTGIGSALLLDSTLIPNTELGHLGVRGKEAEKRASEIVRENKKLSWKKWAGRLSEVLATYEMLLWPDLFVLGGGVSRDHDKFIPLLTCRTPVVPATLENDAGILGAAWYDEETRRASTPAPAKATVKRAPARRAPVKQAPVKQAPVKQAPATPPSTAPAVAAPVTRAPAKRAPRKTAP